MCPSTPKTNNQLSNLRQATTDDASQRLDNYLFKHYPKVPKSAIYRMLRKGEIRVNSKRKTAKYKLEAHDAIRLPPYLAAESKVFVSKPNSLIRQIILADNPSFIAMNKPSGLAVHGGSGIQHGLIEMAREHYDNVNIQLVHRLDRETSGCILLAKKRSSLRILHELFSQRQIKKRYLAVLHGSLSQTGSISHLLEKNILQSGERVVKVVQQGGKLATTHFKILAKTPKYSVVLLTLHTGRTHQIRVQSAALGHPVVGDQKYGQGSDGPNLLLHAYQLQFSFKDEMYCINAPLAPEMANILRQHNVNLAEVPALNP